jgi:hypothetical protein
MARGLGLIRGKNMAMLFYGEQLSAILFGRLGILIQKNSCVQPIYLPPRNGEFMHILHP